MLSELTQYWPLFTGLIGLAVWGLRLESLARMNAKEIEHTNDRVDKVHDDVRVTMAKLDVRLDKINDTLERIIWRLPANKDKPDGT